jgi:hypothetical protein
VNHLDLRSGGTEAPLAREEEAFMALPALPVHARPRVARRPPLSLLIALGIAACSGSGPDTPRSSVPAQLARQWYSGSVSPIGFYNTGTGQWASPSGVVVNGAAMTIYPAPGKKR